MRNNTWLLLFLFIFLFISCRTINRNRTEMGIPQYMVFFSFDDGPDGHGDTTERLLDVLKKYQIKALFCLLGENAECYPELVRRIYDEGHYLINHGYSEKHAFKMSENEFKKNLIKGEAAISAALGFDMYPKLYRPHGGFYNNKQEKICIEEGYTIIPVTVRVYDAVMDRTKQRTVVKQIINKLEKNRGGFILLHDGRDSHLRGEKELEKYPNGPFNRSWIPETVDEIIAALLDRGFDLDGSDILAVLGLDY